MSTPAIIHIRFRDSHHHTDGWRRFDGSEGMPEPIEVCGFQIEEDDTWLTVALAWSRNSDQSIGRLSIPKATIVFRESL